MSLIVDNLFGDIFTKTNNSRSYDLFSFDDDLFQPIQKVAKKAIFQPIEPKSLAGRIAQAALW